MKKIEKRDILKGICDSSYFLHHANERRESLKPIKKLFVDTQLKRNWGVINPGFILAQAYMYFVYGYENKLINSFDFMSYEENIIIDSQESIKINKNEFILHGLKNALINSTVDISSRYDDGEIHRYSDIVFIFTDYNKGSNNPVRFEIDFVTLAIIIENTDTHDYFRNI